MIEPVRGVIGNGPVQKGIPFSPDRPAPAGRLAGASGQPCASEFCPQFGSRGVVDFARLASVKQIAARDAVRCRAEGFDVIEVHGEVHGEVRGGCGKLVPGKSRSAG
jgi:hypothetical protein